MGGPHPRKHLAPPKPLAGEIHVWSASLDVHPRPLQALWSTLTVDERQRAQRLRFCQDRRRFIARRGLLRVMLARYLGAEAHALRFTYGALGKPSVSSQPDGVVLEFSISHSAGVVLLAVASVAGLGIDIEQVDARFDYQDVAVAFFSRHEIEELQRMPRVLAHGLFFRLWSLYEAVGKARGDGLAAFEQFRAGEAVDGPGPSGGCSTVELEVGDGYAAALAVLGSWQLRAQPWDERLASWEARYRVRLESA